MIVVQVIITLIIFVSTEILFPNNHYHRFNTGLLMGLIVVVWGYFLYKFNLGIIFRTQSLFSMLRGYVVTVSFGCFIMFQEILLISHFQEIHYTFKYVVYFGCVNLIALIAFKVFFHRVMLSLRKRGFNTRNVMIIADEKGQEFVESFIQAKDWGYSVHSIVSACEKFVSLFPEGKLIKADEDLLAFIRKKPIDDIFYCLPGKNETFNLERLIAEMNTLGVTLHIMQHNTQIKRKTLFRDSHRFENTFITYQNTSDKYISLKIKDIMDVLLSLLILFAIFPLLVIIALLIKNEDGGSVFFRQERIGQNGRRFVCFKFRTMVMNAEEMLKDLKAQNEADGPVFKIENDPRITRIGRLLRKTSLDELPQFYNVLKGEMSIVGPRPPLLKEVRQYEPEQLRRLSMKPGITCSWQVWGRHQVTFSEWMQMDLDYIDNWSLWLDIKIIISTVGVVLKANGQ